MNYVGKLLSNFKAAYNEINAATLTGAIDVIIIQQEDGSYVSSPFHVRFGKLGVIHSREKVVDIEINGDPVDLHMKLGESGEAFFVEPTDEKSESLFELATSPIATPSPGEIMKEGIKQLKKEQGKEKLSAVLSAPSGLDTLESKREKCRSEVSLESLEKGSLGSSIDGDTGQCKSLSGTPTQSPVRFGLEQEHLELPGRQRKSSARTMSGDSTTAKSSPRHAGKDEDHIPEFNDEEIFDMDPMSDDELRMINMNSMARSVSLPVLEEDKRNSIEEWANSRYASQLYPFSDGDITPVVSPTATRSPSPFSDTEIEKQNVVYDTVLSSEPSENLDWSWGELPQKTLNNVESPLAIEVPTKAPEILIEQAKEEDTGLLTFMRSTKKIRHQPVQEGIYLDDLNLEEMDPEVAALYFPPKHQFTHAHHMQPIRDEDIESGKGSSLPQSPNSVEGAIGGNIQESEHWDLSLSLCGGLKEAEGNIAMDKFLQDYVTYDKFCENAMQIISDPNLVIKIGTRFYNWQTASPMILSVMAFQRPLPDSLITNLIKQHMPKKERAKRAGMSSWFSWRRAPPEDEEKGQVGSQVAGDVSKVEPKKPSSQTSTPTSSPPTSAPNSPQKQRERETGRKKDADDTSTSSDEMEFKQWSPKRRRANSPKNRNSQGQVNFKKSLRLTSEQISKLVRQSRVKLQPGQNTISYSVTTQYQGTSKCVSHIYLWRYDDKIVISDIDGTITRSDVLGNILPMLGKDWSQMGVAKLFNKIHLNGYKFLYLSARAIGQSSLTRSYLKSIRQGELCLPDGPMLLTPSSLINAFHKEVIERKPEEFKINCLKDIASLFPATRPCPFYSGFGNKINDVWAYRAVGIPISRIFSINHRGELRSEISKTFQTSYNSLSDIADHFFPPLHVTSSGVCEIGNFSAADKYSQYTYWREPLPELDDEIANFLKKNKESEASPSKGSKKGK